MSKDGKPGEVVDVNEWKRQGHTPQDGVRVPVAPPPADDTPTPATVPRLATGMRESIARMRRRRDRTEEPLPVPWPGLAAELGRGLWPGTFTLLVGNTGTGKSQWAMQLAWTAARAGNPVAYIALELDVYGMHARALALALRDKNPANAPKWSEFYFGEASEEELERAEAAVEELEQIPLHLEVGTPSGWNYMRLRAIAEGMRREYPERPLLLVLDFLQLVDGAGAEEAELRIRMKNAVAEGRRLAMDPTMNTAVVFLSSTARANYGALSGTEASGSGEKRPQNRKAPMPLGKGDPGRLVGTGKESGDLEYSADTVLVLAREPWPEEGRPANGTHVWLAVAKARARAKSAKGFGWVELRFDGSCFYEPEPTSEAPKEWTA